MNKELKEVKSNLKKIECFIKNKPHPSEGDLKTFLSSENLNEYSKFAEYFRLATWEAAFLKFQKKVNKYN